MEAPAEGPRTRRRIVGNRYDQRVAGAMRLLRTKHPPMSRFAEDLCGALGWESISRQALYDWENAKTRVPAVALMAAAELVGVLLDDVLRSQ